MSSEISQIPLMTTEQKTACEALKAEWLRTKRLTVVILTGMAVCLFIAVNLLHISSVLTMPEVASVVMLAADLLLLIVMALQDSDFKKKVRSTPELDPQGIDPATKAIWQQADPDALGAAMKQYYNPEPDDWYAVTVDANGNVAEAFYKKDAITGSDLTPMTVEQQEKLLSSPFTSKKAVGCYTAPAKDETRDTE